MTDEGLARVGWSTTAASLDLGTDKHGFGWVVVRTGGWSVGPRLAGGLVHHGMWTVMCSCMHVRAAACMHACAQVSGFKV